MKLLERKIDRYLADWKADPSHMPLMIKGARQIGKTESIRQFGRKNYRSLIEINFILQKQYRDIFENGYDADTVIRNISLRDPALAFLPGETLIFFDEIQACPNAATSLKAFREDGRYDVICSGSLMGINYQQIESNSVGNKTDFTMHSMDFEEYLWARGYRPEQIESLYQSMLQLNALSATEMNVLTDLFREFMVLGGMPAIVNRFVTEKNYSGTLKMQRQILLDYEEDITKYAEGLDKGKVLNVYRAIPAFLGKENKKFQITKVAKGARSREYTGVTDWLSDAGIVNVSHCLRYPELPLRGNADPDNYRLYFSDTGLLIGSLDEEAQEDLRYNQNYGTYKGAIYENIVSEMLVKQGYELYFYRNETATTEMDFFVRDRKSLIPIEVKANRGASASLRHLLDETKYPDIRYAIKLTGGNIGRADRIFTFPWFLGFLLKRWLREH